MADERAKQHSERRERNLRGGRVLVGVDDDGTVCGVTRPNLETWVMTACPDKIRPEVIPYFENVHDVEHVEPGRHVAVVTEPLA